MCAAVGKEAAGEAGAIQAIVDAMQRNIFNGTVQEDGCHALRNVAFHCCRWRRWTLEDVKRTNERICGGWLVPNLVLAREQGAIDAVLKAMETHPENEALQAEGCWALLVFCSNTGTLRVRKASELANVVVGLVSRGERRGSEAACVARAQGRRCPDAKGTTHAWNENSTENGSMNCSVDDRKKPIMAIMFKPARNQKHSKLAQITAVCDGRSCQRTGDPGLERREPAREPLVDDLDVRQVGAEQQQEGSGEERHPVADDEAEVVALDVHDAEVLRVGPGPDVGAREDVEQRAEHAEDGGPEVDAAREEADVLALEHGLGAVEVLLKPDLKVVAAVDDLEIRGRVVGEEEDGGQQQRQVHGRVHLVAGLARRLVAAGAVGHGLARDARDEEREGGDGAEAGPEAERVQLPGLAVPRATELTLSGAGTISSSEATRE
ncbi:unnamed protein product [Phytophthora lilii]|uniref:Unnamed protein product n=1 Tax=Phytophthora lilii TaxID=2077276 RepID=A0A9W6T9B0_9STRA|nr:unnamed protein product [Phytophthora lilii]